MRIRRAMAQTIRVCAVSEQKNAVGETLTVYARAAPLSAAVYPLSSAVDMQMYGVKANEMLKCFFERGAEIPLRGGVWLEADAYAQGDQKPPWVVASVAVWPTRVEAVIERT